MGRTTKGQLYQRKSPGDWYLRYYVDGKEIRENLHTTTKRDAEKQRKEIIRRIGAENKADALRERADDIDGNERRKQLRKITVAEAWDIYLENPDRPESTPGTLNDYACNWRMFAEWWKSGRGTKQSALTDVTKDDAKRFAKTLTCGPNRYNKTIRACERVVRFALQAPDSDNPFAAIRSKPLDPQGKREFTEDELRRVCGGATGELRTLLAIGLYTALRLGDSATLKWTEVDGETDCIRRMPGKTKRKGKVIVIPLHPVLSTILDETPQDERGTYVLPDMAAQYERNRPQLSRMIMRHFRDCGIDTHGERSGRNAPPEVSFHSLRHTFVTMAGKAGIPLPVVQELCGHGSPAIQRVYMHMGEEATRGAVMAMPDINSTHTGPKNALPAKSNGTRAMKALALLEAMDADSREMLRDKAVKVLT